MPEQKQEFWRNLPVCEVPDLIDSDDVDVNADDNNITAQFVILTEDSNLLML